MTKQEEIREGIKKIAYNYTCSVESDDFVTDEILQYLNSQGVVIKGNSLGVSHPHLASYYTVEPLIEPYKEGEGD